MAELERFAEVADTDGLALDVEVYLAAMDPQFRLPEDRVLGEYQNRVKLSGVKLFLDGSPQGKTAYLSEPYLVPPAGQGRRLPRLSHGAAGLRGRPSGPLRHR